MLLHSDALRALQYTYGFVVRPEFSAKVVRDKFDTLVMEVHKCEVQVFAYQGEREPFLTLYFSIADKFGDIKQKVAEALKHDRDACAMSFKKPDEIRWHESSASDDERRLGDDVEMGKRIHMLVVRRKLLPTTPKLATPVANMGTKKKNDEDDIDVENEIDAPTPMPSVEGTYVRSVRCQFFRPDPL